MHKFMYNHKIQFNNYIVLFEEITVKKAAILDFESREIYYNSFSECTAFFKNISLQILQDDVIIFDSRKHDSNNLDFNLMYQVYHLIKPYLCLSENEITEFKKVLEDYFSGEEKNRLPYEYIIAQNILNKSVVMSLNEFENMEIKKYEKIQLCIKKILENNSSN